MTADPPMRPDGRCSQCGKPRPVATMRRFAGAYGEADPFCSAPCARAFHGCELARLDNRGRLVDGEETAGAAS